MKKYLYLFFSVKRGLVILFLSFYLFLSCFCLITKRAAGGKDRPGSYNGMAEKNNI